MLQWLPKPDDDDDSDIEYTHTHTHSHRLPYLSMFVYHNNALLTPTQHARCTFSRKTRPLPPQTGAKVSVIILRLFVDFEVACFLFHNII